MGKRVNKNKVYKEQEVLKLLDNIEKKQRLLETSSTIIREFITSMLINTDLDNDITEIIFSNNNIYNIND
jgi:predicted transcriptional regulator YheO